jgi:RNA polymerase sigma-70 factor (sigma-E family)
MADRAERDADFASFVVHAWGPYLRTARLLTGDPHRAEELLQDSLVTLYVHWHRVSRHGNPNAYLRRMLVNGNVSWWRRRRRERLVDAVPEPAVTPVVLSDERDELRWALMHLPWHQRAVVVLRHYEDLSETAVAAALGCSVGTVKSQHARALARLRELLPHHTREGAPR